MSLYHTMKCKIIVADCHLICSFGIISEINYELKFSLQVVLKIEYELKLSITY